MFMNDEEQDQFDKIIQDNNLENLFKHNSGINPTLTLGDLYEGINILSSAQVDLHHYLKDVLEGLRANNQSGYEVVKVPMLTKRQADLLTRIFEDCARFSEDFDVE